MYCRKEMVKILNCYLIPKKSYGTLSKGAMLFGQPCTFDLPFLVSEHSMPTLMIWRYCILQTTWKSLEGVSSQDMATLLENLQI